MAKRRVVINKQTGPRFLLRFLMNALALWIAARLINDVEIAGGLLQLFLSAFVFSVINSVLRPILVVLTLPAVIFSLGLFMLIINGFIVYVASELYAPLMVNGFSEAIVTAIIIWVVNYALSIFFANSKLEIIED